MIRKQLYIGEAHQEKLRRLAHAWGCTEAEIMRSALERLPDPDGDAIERLRAAGLLLAPRGDPDLPADEDLDALERELENFLADEETPLPLSEAVLEDRR